MSGGYQVQTDAIQQAITHLNNLLNDAHFNASQMQMIPHTTRPGDAPETQAFHAKAITGSGSAPSSASDLMTNHAAFITSVQDQISKLQKTLERYQSGEDAAGYGFGN